MQGWELNITYIFCNTVLCYGWSLELQPVPRQWILFQLIRQNSTVKINCFFISYKGLSDIVPKSLTETERKAQSNWRVRWANSAAPSMSIFKPITNASLPCETYCWLVDSFWIESCCERSHSLQWTLHLQCQAKGIVHTHDSRQRDPVRALQKKKMWFS